MDIGITILIGFDLHQGILTGVVDDELHAVDTLAGIGVNLVDHDGSHPLIGDLHRGGLAILHTRLNGSGVQLVAIRRLQLHDAVPAALSIGNADHAIAVCGVGADDLTVDFADLKFDAGDALTGIFIALHNLQSTGRGVVERV